MTAKDWDIETEWQRGNERELKWQRKKVLVRHSEKEKVIKIESDKEKRCIETKGESDRERRRYWDRERRNERECKWK